MRFPTLTATAVVLTAILIEATSAFAADVRSSLRDPIPIRDGFLLNQGFLQPTLESALVAAPGWQFELISTSANTFAKSRVLSEYLRAEGSLPEEGLKGVADEVGEPVFLIDGETLTTTMSFSRTFENRISVGLVIPVYTFNGGWGDSVIEDFHESLGLRDDERPIFAQDSYLVELPGVPEADRWQVEGGSGLGDIAFELRYSRPLGRTKRTWVAAVGQIELPSGEPSRLTGSGSIDSTGGLLLSHTRGSITGHIGSYLTLLGENDSLGTENQLIPSSAFSLVWSPARSTALFLQGSIALSPLRELEIAELAPPVRQVAVGLRQLVSRDLMIHLGIGENIKNYENSSDVVVQLGISTLRF